MINKETLYKGLIGERFILNNSKDRNWKVVPASLEEDIHYGVDIYIDDKPVDIKNTLEIYIANIDKGSGTLKVRHPFKTASKALYYCFVKVEESEPTKGEILEYISVNDKLKEYLKEDQIENFYKKIQEYDNKPIKSFAVSTAQASFRFKQFLTPYLAENVVIKYIETESGVSFTFYRLKGSKTNENTNTPQSGEVINVTV